ncbi:MAG TPA: glutamyl-tRNA amidotransferase [Candidatus Omnitrophica bacterium]|nr:glutamyl-tRNA amidotransferase [Candidatus Omnitrophota bacterium]
MREEKSMLEDQLQKDYIQAMKDRDAVKSSTVNFLRAQLKNVRIEKRSETLEDKDVVAVIKKQIKQRQDSIEQYEKGGRRDLADKETAEMAILKTYLPEELSGEVLQQLVDQAVAETGAQSMKDMGNVIKAVAAKAQGKADNRVISELVKKALSGK